MVVIGEYEFDIIVILFVCMCLLVFGEFVCVNMFGGVDGYLKFVMFY